MPINLKVKCHGMIGYVPANDGSRMAAILCKGEDTLIPNQAAYVRFPVGNYRSEQLRPPTPAPAGMTNAEGLGHISLDQERLTIKSDQVNATDTALTIDMFKDPDGDGAPTGRDDKSFIWMPDINELTNGSGAINPAHLAKNPAGANPPVLARVDFAQGRFGTTGAGSGTVDFQDGNQPPVRKSIAREALLDLQLDSNTFTLQLEKFDGSGSTDLVFEAEGDLEIVIGNEAAADIYNDMPPGTLQEFQERAAHEFNIYYGMCVMFPAVRPLPRLTSLPGLQTACSGGRYPAVDPGVFS